MEVFTLTKPYKLYSKASMAAILATAAIVPAATASAEAVQTDVAKVVFEQDGKTLSLPVKEYNKAKALGTLDGTQEVKYVTDTKGNSYLASDYKKAFALNGKDKAEALNKLAADNKQQDLPNITEGKIVDGKVVSDETPEEKVNETFFYNLAA